MKDEALWESIKAVAQTMTLDKHDGEMTWEELTEYLGVRKYKGQKMVKQLIEQGLLGRRAGKYNRWIYYPIEKE
jgi:predicted transcriptional regulator